MENFKIICHKSPSLKIKIKSKFYYFNRNFESFDKLSDDRRNELIIDAKSLKDRYIDMYEHLFKMVKWEDEEPTLISDLLEGKQ